MENNSTKTQSSIENMMAQGIEESETEETFFTHRVSNLLLIAAFNLIILCLWFLIIFIKDSSQFPNVLYTGLSAVIILLIRNYLKRGKNRWMVGLFLYTYMFLGLFIAFAFSFWFFRFMLFDRLLFMTPVLCPATLFLLLVPLHAVYLLGNRGVIIFLIATIVAFSLLLLKTLSLDLTHDEKMINIAIFGCQVILLLQITWSGWTSRRATEKKSEALILARDLALEASKAKSQFLV